MTKKHFVIIIPGLGDETQLLNLVTANWVKHDLHPIIHSMEWRDKSRFHPKLNKLIRLIDRLSRNDYVSLVGTSAGGSAALNAFLERKNKIRRVINICGRLRTGPLSGFRSFQSKTSSSPAFAQSVKLTESKEHLLSKNNRKKIMTVRSLFGDELVPPETTTIKGGFNTYIPMIGHVLSIAAALTIFSRSVIKFLKE